jgi:hypothetical protein
LRVTGEIGSVMRHSNAKVTVEHYIKKNETDKLAAMKKYDQVQEERRAECRAETVISASRRVN